MRDDDELNDSLDDLLGGAIVGKPKTPPAHYQPPAPKGYFESCPRCRGTGQTPWGPCFRCKGEKGKTYKTSPEARAKGRENAAKASAKREQGKAEWREEHKAELAWLNATIERQQARAHKGQSTWNFPIELGEKLAQYGTLTDGQLAAVQRCMAKDAERAEQRQTERAARDAAAPSVDVTKLEEAFATARSKAKDMGARGINRLHLRLQSGDHSIVFSPGSPGSEWEGMIFAKAEGKKLGWIKAGKFTARYECTPEEQSAVVDCCNDPLKAALAYGQRWSCCAVCGRTLTNDGSIEAGVGPICAARFGWTV